MDSDGTQDARGTHANPVPRPAGPPERPPVPPRPAQAPGVPPVPEQASRSSSSVADWLNAARPSARPGIWRYGYRPPKGAQAPERLAPVTVAGMLIPFVVALVVWSAWRRGVMPYQFVVLRLLTPSSWWWGGTSTSPKEQVGQSVRFPGWEALTVYDGVFFAVLVGAVAMLGSWPAIIRHYVGRRPQPSRALIAALLALVALSFVFPEAFPIVGWDAVPIVDPLLSLVVLLSDGYELMASPLFTNTLYAVITLLVLWPFARVGGWWTYAKERLGARRASTSPAAPKAVRRPRAQWPELRDAGQQEAAEVLTTEVAAGGMNDVDCARVTRAWAAARRDGTQAAFRDTILRQAGAAWTHPSGDRDLHRRTTRHDLLTGQVRIGRWAAAERAPLAFHDAGAALGPDVLGTSLLAVGPSGSGKTQTLIEPVTEALTLQALTGGCTVVAVSAAGSPLGSDSAFDVIVRIGDPSSVHDLDPYAESDDPDEAAAILAEALVGDLDGVSGQSAATALAQLLGPHRAVHGRFPTLPELRELLEGEPGALAALRDALAGDEVMRRELDARMRQTGAPGDAGRALADRLALLNRPVFADFFGGGSAHRVFSLRAVAHHPLRVRIDLPERGHEEAARLITRLVAAQFHTVVREGRRSHFACLVLDDATGTVTAESVRRIQRLRSQNAGVVLALRSVGDVPEALHGPLYGAVGCRMAFSGVTTWDGSRFAQAWGTEWVETTEVAKHTVFADQPMTRAIHALRKLVTGKAVTTDAVTVRQVERERWSASELAHAVPPGHAVLSLTTVKGEHAPPLLVDLRGRGS
ncbi:ATP/GTP-binding protein [Streptomyces yaanensis]|uniref:ATP/GTP-binding protein n=1 Tax=Streptomyces yaanensis TaxID=1142239 RepID=A0ABV7SE93_9ACTN|nr:ATP/GTP-binding protein [Streptomyces sp. CGMCC 4.7035]WNB98095.1 ATP/GTP-binding protein [Streptomyces sp. CGMCC 4.7035]